MQLFQNVVQKYKIKNLKPIVNSFYFHLNFDTIFIHILLNSILIYLLPNWKNWIYISKGKVVQCVHEVTNIEWVTTSRSLGLWFGKKTVENTQFDYLETCWVSQLECIHRLQSIHSSFYFMKWLITNTTASNDPVTSFNLVHVTNRKLLIRFFHICVLRQSIAFIST